jgi:integrase
MGVTVRERDGAWWVFVHHKGRRKAKRVGAKAAAREVAAKIQARLTLGKFKLAEDPPCPTFREYAERWIALPHEWKESSRRNYDACLRHYCYPAFGKLRLDELTRKGLMAFFNAVQAKGRARATVRTIKVAISGVLGAAVDDELIERNPVAEIKFKYHKQHGKKGGDALTAEEAALLLEEVRQFQGGRYYPPMLCALRTGMRIGEIEALQWGDVDFAGGFIQVQRSHRAGRMTDTKTGATGRVDMSPMLAECLRQLKAQRKVVSLEEDGWVFAGGRGCMLRRKDFEHALHHCLERAGLRRVRVHDLRHTYATVRLMKGHNVLDVSRQLRHSSPRITLDTYAHAVPGKFKSEVAELDAVQPPATQAQPTTAEPHQR